MSVVKELLRAESDGTVSFGDYTLEKKAKLPDFEHKGDIYYVKTYAESTRLEKNGMFVYESVPGTAVTAFQVREDGVSFCVDGAQDAQVTLELAEENGYTFIHPFDDEVVATGQGSIAMEIIKELPTVDMILAPIGGGGLVCGVSTLAKLLNPNIRIVGVEPAGAGCMQESIRQGRVVSLPAVNTIADGTAVKTPGSNIFPYIQKNVDEIVTVDDHELIVNFLDMVENHKMIVENSGLLSVSALKQLDCEGKKVVCILSGGNMDVITMSSVVQHGLIQRDRIFTVSIQLPDRPGELLHVADVIAGSQGNIIRLEHNQFVSINRNAAVELTITMEAFGSEHREAIIEDLKKAGYAPRQERPTGVY